MKLILTSFLQFFSFVCIYAQTYCNSGSTDPVHIAIKNFINAYRAAEGGSTAKNPLTLVSEASHAAYLKLMEANYVAPCAGFQIQNSGWVDPITCCPNNERTMNCGSDVLSSLYNKTTAETAYVEIGANELDTELTIDNLNTELPKAIATPFFEFLIGHGAGNGVTYEYMGISTMGKRLSVFAIPNSRSFGYTTCSTTSHANKPRSVSFIALFISIMVTVFAK